MKNYWEKFSEDSKKYARYVGLENFNYGVNISLRYKYVYVETPKVACSSIKTVLQKMELDITDLFREEFEDIHVRDYSPLLKPSQVGDFSAFVENEDVVKFCFVRNPYSRLLSAYLEKIRGNKPQKKSILAQLGFNPLDIERKISFKEFVNAVSVQPVEFMDPHWRVQYFQTMQDSIRYDFIGKLEAFDEDFSKVLSRINSHYIKYLSGEKRHSTEAKAKLGEYYDEELRDLVYSKYKKDFDFFGYNPAIFEISSEEAKEVETRELSEEKIRHINGILYDNPQRIENTETVRFTNLLEEKNAAIDSMKASSFWQLRGIYIRIKNMLPGIRKTIENPELVMTLLVRDEIDIIEKNIQYHLRHGVDFIIATDNGSRDGTREILKKYEKKGVLYLIDEKNQDYSQSVWVNRMGKIAYEKFHAKFIFHCDADEFWHAKSGNLKREISKADSDVLTVDMVNVLLKENGGTEKFPDDAVWAVVNPKATDNLEMDSKNESIYMFKYPPKVIFRTQKRFLEVMQGNHAISGNTEDLAIKRSEDITIYHYPVRSKKHFLEKVANGGRAYEANKKLDKSIGWHWRRWYESHKNNTLDIDYRKLIIDKDGANKLIEKGIVSKIKPNEII